MFHVEITLLLARHAVQPEKQLKNVTKYILKEKKYAQFT